MKNCLLTIVFLVAFTVCAAPDSVRVKELGFDPVDSTRFVQQALDSGARTIYLDRMSSPWIVEPLVGRSNTELVFVDGAKLQAKRGAFLGKEDSLLTFSMVSNVVVRGEGKPGEMKMWHDDYLDKSRYVRTEWRHGLRLFSVVNARIENLFIHETGGDGIIVSKQYGRRGGKECRNIEIRNCVLDGNLRQGISVITVDGLRMYNTVMSHTCGLNPMAGIDIEPNAPGEICRDIYLEGCRTFGNKGSGYELAFQAFNKESAPIDVTLVNCTSDGDARPFAFNGSANDKAGNVSGRVNVKGCQFRNPTCSPFALQSPRKINVRMTFTDCTFENKGVVEKTDSAWMRRNLLAFSEAAETLPSARRVVSPSARVTDTARGQMRSLARLSLRRAVRYCFYADQAKTCHFRCEQMKLGAYPPIKAPFELFDLQGKKLSSHPIPPAKGELAVPVPSAGFYVLACDVGGCAVRLTEANVPVAIDLTTGFCSVYNSTGEVYLAVPEGNGMFGAYATGQLGELVSVTLTDSDGKIRWQDSAVCGWRGFVSDACEKAGLWKLTLAQPSCGSFEDYMLDLGGVPGYLFLSEKGYWQNDPHESRSLAAKKDDSSLMFLSTFDTRSVTADLARGEGKSLTLANLDLSLRGCVGFDGQQAFQPETGETLKYPAKGNFDPHRGTLVFWARGDLYDPQDEKTDGQMRGNVVLAHLKATEGSRWIAYTFYIYRNIFFGVWSNHIKASVGSQGIVQGRLLGIKKGEWYQIAVTWDDEKLTYYLNGNRVCVSPLPEKKEATSDLQPDAGPESFIAVKPVHYEDDNSLTTSLDDFAIYDRPLSPIEINNAYVAVAPNRRGLKRQILSVSVRGAAKNPKGPATRLVAEIDGAGIDFSKGSVSAAWSLVGPNGLHQTGTWTLAEKESKKYIENITSVGDHTLTVTVGTASATARFNRPDLSWVGNTIADEDEVPPLWKDFTVRGRNITLWNRAYRFAEGPLPVSILACGRELLVEPPRVLIDGREPAWTSGPTEQKKRLVVYTGTGQLGAARITYRTTVEFDGLINCTWKVCGRPEISSLRLQWRVDPAVAEFLLTPKVSEGDPHVAFPFPRSVSHPKMLWFASEGRGGFAWTAITDANWISEKGANVIFADRQTGACRVEMITRKTHMPDDVPYGALFIATPTRPLPARKHLIRHAAQVAGGARFMNAGAEPAIDSCFTHAPRDEFDIFNRTVSNRPPASICLYGGAQSFSADLPMAVFLEKYLMLPGVYRYSMPSSRLQSDGTRKDGRTTSIPVCSNAFANDYSFWCDAQLWAHAYNDRVAYTYFDLCECLPCRNHEHGCGYRDCFGREVATFTTLGMREFARRITTLAHRHGREVILHAQRDFLPFADGLADYWYPGEQHNGDLIANRWAYTDTISDTIWRSEFNREVLGVGIIQAPVFGQSPKTAEVRFKPEYTESMLAALLPYDIESGWAYTDPSVMAKVCTIFERVGLASPETVCHKFYRQTEIVPSDPAVRVTWYELPKGLKLLVVANKTPHAKDVTLDVRKLGRTFVAKEEYRGAPLFCADGRLTLTVPARNFQLVTLR